MRHLRCQGGALSTDRRIFTSLIGLSPGDVFSPSKVEKCRRQLQALGVFSAVDIKLLDPETVEPVKHIVIYVRERYSHQASLADVVSCVRHHHEWFDGSERGYPARLVGDQIPLPSRIILVADTLEAMTSDRPYRKGLALENVLAELRLFSGTQFDPACVVAMLRLLERQGESFLSRGRTFDIHAFLEV